MLITILKVPEMPMPDSNVRILQNFGWIEIFTGEDPLSPMSRIVRGEHIALNGEEKDIKNYIDQFDEVWIGRGMPMLQQFYLKRKADQN